MISFTIFSCSICLSANFIFLYSLVLFHSEPHIRYLLVSGRTFRLFLFPNYVNGAAMHMAEQVFVEQNVWFSGHMSKNGRAGCYGIYFWLF